MSDGDTAASLMDEVIGYRGIRENVESMLERAYRELCRRNAEWTRRRVRAIWSKEARRIEYFEIEDMKFVIEARKRHADYRKETTRLASMARDRAADRGRRMAPELGRRLGGMDRAGTEDSPR